MKFKPEEITHFKLLSQGRVETIQKIVGEFFKVTQENIISSKRTTALCEIRFIAIRYAKDNVKNLSLKGIGYFFGERDHSTIIHALDQADELLSKYPAYQIKELNDRIEAALKNLEVYTWEVKEAVK